ncbi:MAG: hypothetical protein C3F02_00860 [Parcubacteria group bacterium]|nr:MAG: hypothetical protein C3F02_00860 [Parcubacteria group bacterium]
MTESQSREHTPQAGSFPSPENIGLPEKKAENFNAVSDIAEEKQPASPVILPSLPVSVPSTGGTPIYLEKVEQILAENMDSIFLSMDAASQNTFKIKGEQTAHKIVGLLSQTRVKLKDVINVIIDWLRLIPHVNRYYLEQEAKLKADAIMRLYNK